MKVEPEPNYEQLFPVGARVICESEMWPGKWERGVVVAHNRSRYNDRMSVRIRLEADNEQSDGALVDYDYRYLDANPHHSLVRLARRNNGR